MSRTRPFCLSIAGFDPSGGAGLAADLKTFEKLKVLGLGVQTANTVQTDSEFRSYNWVDTDLLIAQLNCTLQKYQPKYIKIGLLEDADILRRILTDIRKTVPTAIVTWDPVMRPSAGGNEQDPAGFREALLELLRDIDYFTPNMPEYSFLCETALPETLSEKTQTGILLKGGHASERRGKDYFYYSGKVYPLNPQIATSLGKHGTGCILSSAFCAYLAQGYAPLKAVLRAKRFTEKRIISNPGNLSYFS